MAEQKPLMKMIWHFVDVRILLLGLKSICTWSAPAFSLRSVLGTLDVTIRSDGSAAQLAKALYAQSVRIIAEGGSVTLLCSAILPLKIQYYNRPKEENQCSQQCIGQA